MVYSMRGQVFPDRYGLNEIVRRVREKLGFSQSGFANLMGPLYTRAMIANYETSRAKVPGEVVFTVLVGIGSLVDITDCFGEVNNVVWDPAQLKNWKYPRGYPIDKTPGA